MSEPQDPSAIRPALIRLDGVAKRFGGAAAVDGVSLDIAEGEMFALLGPSGCGKTTLMRLIAGFEQPDAGRVLLGAEDLEGRPPHRRPVNLMFQSYALFPHLSVAGNVAYGLRRERLARREIAARVAEMLALVQLEPLADRRPDQLSGGERQRTALARALAKRPKVLLLDEPLAALDRRLREQTRTELKAIQRRLSTTFVVVTHDQDEAMGLADRLGLMREGKIVQVGTPAEVYRAPADRWAAEFLGEVNLFEGRLEAGRFVSPLFPQGLQIPAREDGPAWLALRPEAAALHAEPTGGALPGRIVEASYLGDRSLYRVALDAGPILLATAGGAAAPFPRETRVFAVLDTAAATVLAR